MLEVGEKDLAVKKGIARKKMLLQIGLTASLILLALLVTACFSANFPYPELLSGREEKYNFLYVDKERSQLP
ncbi:hypothetical protein SY88_18855 [Clostridiales bacterium PH28_bin88]|nr:hypothetical protein SY88_18855 [Clostridiales bacterium PH28_bin88]